jgi:aryl-alcohol dehydrogenase-like predicted oxidoreductase
MDLRPLGRTGVGVNFVDTADVYSAGESEQPCRRDESSWSGLPQAPNIIGPRSSGGRWATTPTAAASHAAGSSPRSRTRCALTDLVQQGKVRYIGSSSFSPGQIVEAQWAARERRLERFRTEQPPYSLLIRGIELDVLPTAQAPQHGHPHLQPARRRLAVRALDRRQLADLARAAAAGGALRHVAAREPAQARSSRAARQGRRRRRLSLIELAIAFVVNHPAVSSAIIGPRTMEQLDSQLSAADVALDSALLDRIDEIVRPGVNVNPADTSHCEHVLQPALGRR